MRHSRFLHAQGQRLTAADVHFSWERMPAAVKNFHERARRTLAPREAAGIPFVNVDGYAVAESGFPAPTLEAFVRMKLISFRLKGKAHLPDLPRHQAD